MKHTLRAFLGALAIGVSVAGAQMWFFDTPLTGAEEVPPSGSPATGRATGTYDQSTNVLRIMVNATNFESDIRFGHIHRGARGTNGPVVIGLTNMSGDSRVWMSDETFVLSDEQETQFISGLFYVNLHTQLYPGGAVRGQIEPVPEPASALALSAGLLLCLRRRRR
ncbi:MAG: CHRD domain-containing protein [Armatimonadetes bacterium]|nr:CHRD domain-containing protein [Armatimonadota bacterium]